MATIHLVHPVIRTALQAILVSLGILMHLGCTRAEKGSATNATNTYRESDGAVLKIPYDVEDIFLKATIFLHLKDGSIIRPKLYYYQPRKVFFKPRQIEEAGRIWQTLAQNAAPERRLLYLPTGEEIDKYLFLIRKPLGPKENQPIQGTKVYDWSDWYLLKVPASSVSSKKSIKFPTFDEIKNRVMIATERKLLNDLVARYEKIEAASKKEMNSPVPPRGGSSQIDSSKKAKEKGE